MCGSGNLEEPEATSPALPSGFLGFEINDPQKTEFWALAFEAMEVV